MAGDRQRDGGRCAGGAVCDLPGAVLYGALDLELADMKTVNELWQQSQNDAEGMRLGYTTQQHYFAALVRAEAQAEEREACAKVAGWLWQQFQDTKDAHERNTMESFNPHRFGFNLSAVQQSRQMMDAIRARGNK